MQDKPRRPITVSIVSHGQESLVLPLLQQLELHCMKWIDKVVLTANIPEPSSDLDVPQELQIQRVRNANPKGFGANHNAAFALCESPWFVVLNPDIRLDTDVLGALLELAQPHDAVLAPRIFEPGSPHAGPEPHRQLLTPLEIVQRNRDGYRAPRHPDWIAGMFMLLRSPAFRQIDGFDERFFMYGEDFDLCARLRLAGWQIHVGEDLRVVHDARRASRNDRRHLYWHFASLARVWMSRAFWRYRKLLRDSAGAR